MNRAKKREQERLYVERVRNAAMDFLGGFCKHCGFSDRRALQVDHIAGGGASDRRTILRNNHSLSRDVFANPLKYQLLCANCNVIKRIVNKEN